MCGRRLVVAAILVDDLAQPTRVLAARRRNPPELRGRWEFPGGKVQPDEAPVEALTREIAEELGVTIQVGSEVRHPSAECWPISATYELRCWLASSASGVPAAGSSHDAISWLGPDELGAVDWLDADRPVADLLQQRFPRVGRVYRPAPATTSSASTS